VRLVPDLLEAAADRDGEHEAFVDGDTRLTFGQWQRAAAGVSGVLAELGVGHGDVVCLMLPSSADYAICYQAAMRLGAITSGINLRLGPAEIGHIISRTEPAVIVHADEVTPPVCDARLLPRSALGPAASSPSPGRARLDPRDPVAIVWTSGTTGVPKGAVFDHENLRAVADGVGILSRRRDRRLSPLPFAHVAFMTRPWDEIANMITTVIVPSPWTAADALRLIEAERVTVAQGVPTQWALMLAHPSLPATDLSSLRLASTGAAPVPAELVREMRARLGVPVVVRYTSTEASLTTGTRVDDADEVVATTVGVPAPNVEVMLTDDAGAPVPSGSIGTVRVRSEAVMRGYWRDPAATAAVLSADGWLTTGDLGRVDEDGNLRLSGRRSEMYIRGGYNVYPTEVEAALGEHPAVDRVAVVGVPDPVLGQIGVAAVVPAAGARPSLDDLRSWCRQRLADYKAPDRVELVEDLPLTPMLKVDKQALVAALTVAHTEGVR
jgi:acyl-CoA synthetase (AMP-forming)/AMP-acid ligase II